MGKLKFGYIAIFFFLIIVGGIYFSKDVILNLVGNKPTPVTEKIEIEYWGLFLPEQVIDPLIKEYQLENPNIVINYRERNFNDDLSDYKDTLKTRLKNGTGPDIFRMHSTWFVPLDSELSTNSKVLDATTFSEKFYPIAGRHCINQSKEIRCIPLMYDGLVILYNNDMFEESGLNPPKTWEELRTISSKLTELDGRTITRSGAALGRADNISNSADILTLIMVQNGVTMPDGLNSEEAKSSLEYYRSFEKNKIWDQTLPNSTLAFASEKVAMIFAKRWEILEILDINPTLDFTVTTVPQVPKLDGTTTNVTWASYWVEGVSNDSSDKVQEEAWKFLVWLSEPEQQKKMFKESSKYYKFGEVYSDVSLKNDLINTPMLGAFVKQAPTATTWMTSETSGNDEYSEIMNGIIDGTYNLNTAQGLFISQMKKDGYR